MRERDRAAPGTAPAATVDPLGEALGRVLEPLIKRAVAEAFEALETREQFRPEYVDRSAMAELMGVCTATVANLERRGLPRVQVGDSVRYRPADVFTWVEQRTTDQAEASSGAVADGSAKPPTLRLARRGGR
jgi:hypothetical protein